MIISNGLYGRLGNNIIQFSNIIDIAIAYKHNIKINVSLNFFDLSIIEEYFKDYDNREIITDKFNFYYNERLPFPNDIFKQNIQERNNLLKKAFLINNITKLPENDLVIHIRSGDIFVNPHPAYVPPPLSYYIREINSRKYERIHIICEDTVNPVVNSLLSLYENANHEKRTLENDIKIILGATNIIQSIGTFIPSLLLFSNNIRFVHDSFKNESQEYYKVMYPWKNTSEQNKYILSYVCLK